MSGENRAVDSVQSDEKHTSESVDTPIQPHNTPTNSLNTPIQPLNPPIQPLNTPINPLDPYLMRVIDSEIKDMQNTINSVSQLTKNIAELQNSKKTGKLSLSFVAYLIRELSKPCFEREWYDISSVTNYELLETEIIENNLFIVDDHDTVSRQLIEFIINKFDKCDRLDRFLFDLFESNADTIPIVLPYSKETCSEIFKQLMLHDTRKSLDWNTAINREFHLRRRFIQKKLASVYNSNHKLLEKYKHSLYHQECNSLILYNGNQPTNLIQCDANGCRMSSGPIIPINITCSGITRPEDPFVTLLNLTPALVESQKKTPEDINRLTYDISNLTEKINHLNEKLSNACDTIARLQTENQRMQFDTAQYRAFIETLKTWISPN